MLILVACQGTKTSNSNDSNEKNVADSKLLEKLSTSKLGASNPQLLFADDSTAIIYNYSGLIVFNYEEKQIIRALDFNEMNIQVQGDDAWSIYVEEKGAIVFFEKLSTGEALLYDILKDDLSNLDSAVLEQGTLSDQYDIYNNYIEFYEGDIEHISKDLYPISNLIQLADDTYIYLFYESDTMTLGDLKLVITSPKSTDIIPIFP